MPLKIVRNDITKMNTDIIVNTANEYPVVGTGCDHAVYIAAGYDELLAYREKKIGYVPQGEVFITPAYNLPVNYIIHAVSPLYEGGKAGEDIKLRSCYKKSLLLAKEKGAKSISFPLIATGGFGYPKEEGMRIAIDEINAFLLSNEMLIFLVVFDERATGLGSHVYPGLESFIDNHYVAKKNAEEYDDSIRRNPRSARNIERIRSEISSTLANEEASKNASTNTSTISSTNGNAVASLDELLDDMEQVLDERMKHLKDTFSQYLLYLIEQKGMTNMEVYKRAIVDKKAFSKLKNNVNYQPKKLTALCLCIGAKLNLSETKDLLARAGYALSPCDKTDIIFAYFIENKIYDMIELDIQLEEHGLPCIIV